MRFASALFVTLAATGSVAAAGPARASEPPSGSSAPAPAPSSPPGAPSPSGPPGAPAPGAPPGASDPPAPSAPAAEAAIDVTVAGTQAKNTAGSAHVMRGKQLERFEHDDPHQVLLGVPGVTVRGEDGYGLRPNIGIRGTISDRSKKLTLMEDGILFGPAPYSAPAAYYFPLITRMAGVQVVKGPSTISFGPNTVAGSINLVTAPIPLDPKGSLDLGFGQFLYRKAHVRQGLSDEKYGVLIEGVHLGTSGFKELDGGGDTGFTRNEWMLKARRVLPSHAGVTGEVELKLGYSGEVSNETYLGLTDADFRATPYRRYAASKLDRMEWHRTAVQLTHRAKVGEAEVVSTVYRHDLHRVWNRVQGLRGGSLADVLANPGTGRNAVLFAALTGATPAQTDDELLNIGPNDRTFVSQGLQTTLKWAPKTGPVAHRIELGTRLHHDSIARRHTQDAYVVDGAQVSRAERPTEQTADNFAEAFALAMYAIDAATLGPVTLTAGARVESIRTHFTDLATGVREGALQQVVLPGAGIFVALPQSLGLFAGVNQGFSPIPPGQLAPSRPEKSVVYEAGARWSPRRFRAEVVGFFNDYQNLTNVCTFSSGCAQDGVDVQTNAGAAAVWGVEAYLESELRVTKSLAVPGRVAYTYTNATFSTDFTSSDPFFGDVKKGDVVPYVPEHQLAASVGLEHARFAVNVGGTYVGAMREVAGQGPLEPASSTDEHFLLDASISGKPVRFLTLYVTGKNLTNQAYLVSRRPFGARPGAPLWIQGGVKAEW
jgi:Fe(3+) dicitrate transport protein